MTTDKRTVRLFQGDVRAVLRSLPEGKVQTVVTSPPYWALRDYKVDGQIGSEETPEEFVDVMVSVFREVSRVLRDDGTLWLNIGHGYQSDGSMDCTSWMLALALKADGWILRQDIIWHKPSPMPESISNRCTKAHEYLFLLAKRKGYYYDNEAIREITGSEVSSEEYQEIKKQASSEVWFPTAEGQIEEGKKTEKRLGVSHPNGRNKRSVWTIASEGYAGAHFATFPKALVEPCILAGTSEYGCCIECEAPYRRITERTKLKRDRPNEYVKYARDVSHEKSQNTPGKRPQAGLAELRVTNKLARMNSCGNTIAGVSIKTLGWERTCDCETEEVRPCLVLDPFVGSGTTCQVAIRQGRFSWGIDLSEKYLKENAIPRIESELFSVADNAWLVPRVVHKMI